MYYRKKGNRWYWSTTIVDERTGKRKHIERAGGATKAAAREAALKAIKGLTNASGHLSEPERMTLRELWSRYYSDRCEGQLKPNTLKAYRMAAEHHILPELGELLIGDIRPIRIQRYFDEQAATMSHGSLALQLCVLRSMFRYAVALCDFLTANPASQVRVPAKAAPKVVTHVFTPDELQQIFNYYPPAHRLHTPIMLAYYTGMRAGECLALRWSDVDFDNMIISVHATMYCDDDGTGIVQDSPKTKSSVRSVPICRKLAAELKTAHAIQSQRQLLFGRLYKPDGDFVCTRQNGHSMTIRDINVFNQFCRKTFGAGSFHSLRHTHATMMLEAGESIEAVSKRLGHATIAMTANVYAHMRKKRVRQSSALIDQAL